MLPKMASSSSVVASIYPASFLFCLQHNRKEIKSKTVKFDKYYSFCLYINLSASW